MYELISRRFLAIFYPQAVFEKMSITTDVGEEKFFSNTKVCSEQGYLEILNPNKNGPADKNISEYTNV